MKTLIIAGGSVDGKLIQSFIKDELQDGYFLIACDRGFNICDSIGLRPDLVIGDFDSAADGSLERVQESLIQFIKLDPIKDDTDVEAALRFAFERPDLDERIYILGGTGTRLDHVLGNVSLLALAASKGREAMLVNETNRIRVIRGGARLVIKKDQQYGKYISVFPYMGPVKNLVMTGFKYQTYGQTINGFNTLTVSNEIVDYEATITFDSGYLVVMETRD